MAIMTLTGNLLAEWTFRIPDLKRGKTHRARESGFQVGGKGVNVTRILKHLGQPGEAVGFAEGPLGEYCSAWLERKGIRHRFFPLGEDVRPGLVVREPGNNPPETTFLGLDQPVPAASWRDALHQIRSSKPSWLAVCGSIPGWESDWCLSVRDLLTAPSAPRLAVDTYGPPLADLVHLPLDLVKINRDELDRLTGLDRSTGTLEAVRRAAAGSPVRNWIITDGAASITALLAGGGTLLVKPASIREVSPTGSGDTFLAALLSGWNQDLLSEEALSWATACASANSASAGIGDFPLPVDETFRPRIYPAGQAAD
jgi:fructose-1-phosphate kinase PfkB-like protein